MDTFKPGDKVMFTVQGQVVSDNGVVIAIDEENSGYTHYIYHDKVTSLALIQRHYEEGKAYKDGDGDILIRKFEATGMAAWIDADGDIWPDDYATEPVVLLPGQDD